MSRLTYLLTLILACFNTLCDAEELTTDALIRGLNHADRTIQNGEVRAIITVKRASGRTEKEIEVWKQAERKRDLERFRPRPDIGLKEFEEEYLAPMLEFQANRLREYTTIYHVTSLFRILSRGPLLYQYKLTQQEVEGLSLDSHPALNSQQSTFALFAHDSKKQVKQSIGNAVYPKAPHQAVRFFGTDSEHFCIWNFSYLGRSNGSVPPETKYIGEEHLDSTRCHILEFTGRSTYRLWVEVADKNFSVRKSEIRKSPDAHLKEHSVYKQFEQFGDVWLPKVSEITRYGKDGSFRTEIRIEIITAQFNVTFPENFFDIDRNFYYQQHRRGRPPKPLPDSGMSPPTTPPTETEELLLFCGPQSLLTELWLARVPIATTR